MSETMKSNTIFVQVVDRPARKLILKRGVKAEDYYAYCEEVGCEVWDVLTGLQQALYEPIGMWLPANMIQPGTSVYAQGVEMPLNYNGPIPEGFDCIELPPCQMMIFQGQPYDDANFEEAMYGAQSENYFLICIDRPLGKRIIQGDEVKLVFSSTGLYTYPTAEGAIATVPSGIVKSGTII